MVTKTISQRISLEGDADIKKKLQDLGTTGERSFKQIQTAGEAIKLDPAKFAQLDQALNSLTATAQKLGAQFQDLSTKATAFGTQGIDAATNLIQSLDKLSQSATATGKSLQDAVTNWLTGGKSAGDAMLSASTKFGIASVGFVAAVSAIAGALTKGAVETGVALTEQAEKLKLTTAAWILLRKAIAGSDISNDDMTESLGKVTGQLKEAEGGVARFGNTTERAFKLANGVVVVVRKMNDTLTDTSGKSSQAASDLVKAGASMRDIASGNTLGVLQGIATAIDKMRDSTKQTAAGTKEFGDNWKEVVKALLSTKKPIDEAGKSLAELGKMHRDMTPAQAEQAKEVQKAWEDVGTALRAVRDQIGVMFFGGALAKAQWLSNLIDGSAELLRQWVKLDVEGKKTFMAGLGTTATEKAFKVLIAVGTVLAGIWTDVLVPAGNVMLGMFARIAAMFPGLTGTDVAGWFIAVTIALAGLAIALKGIGLVLSPLALLFSTVFSPLGLVLIPLIALVVLFWNEIKAGAQQVAALIPGELALIGNAFRRLFQGDFSGFWTDFSTAATSAFNKIWKAIAQSDTIFGDFFRAISGEGKVNTPWVGQLVNGFREIGKSIPGTIRLIITSLIALGNAAQGTADIINRVFGLEGEQKVTGTDVAAIVIIGQMTGGLQALSAAATVAAAGVAILSGAVAILVALFGGPATIGFLLLIGALTVAFTKFKPEIEAANKWLDEFVNKPTEKAFAWLNVKFREVIAFFKQDIADGNAWLDEWVNRPTDTAFAWIATKFATAVQAIKPWIDQANGWIRDWVTTPIENAFNWLINKFLDILSRIKQGIADMAAASGGTLAPGGGEAGGFAGGGRVGGRGTGTSYSNLAWLSRGEYITPAAAVRQPGVLAFLEALRRSGGNLRNAIDRMGHFAMGGLVMPGPIAIPAFAGGGMNNVTIQFPGLPEITGLRASSDVVGELRKAAAMAQVRSGGRKPSRFS